MPVNIYDMADTWNNGGTVFNAIKMNILDTASDSNSNLINLQIGGTLRFRVRKDGTIFFDSGAGGASSIVPDSNNMYLGDGGQARLAIRSNAGNPSITIAQFMALGFSASAITAAADADTAFSRIGANDMALGNGVVGDATGNLRVGSLRINQTPTANSSASTTITNGADSSSNLGHRASFNMNGTTYWFPCGSVAF